MIANLRRQTQAHGHVPTLWDAHTWTDMVPHPLPARIRLDTGKDIEPGLEPWGEAVGDFNRLMHGVLGGKHPFLARRRPPDRRVAVELEHGLPRFQSVRSVDLDLEIALGSNDTRPPKAETHNGQPSSHRFLPRHESVLSYGRGAIDFYSHWVVWQRWTSAVMLVALHGNRHTCGSRV